MTKSNMGGKGLFALPFHITVHHRRESGQELRQGKNLEAGVDTEAMKGCCFIVHFSGLGYTNLDFTHHVSEIIFLL